MTGRLVSMRDAFADAMLDLASEDPNVLVVDADVAGPTRLDSFASAFPERFIEVGIAEQNMMGVAAGLALMGFKPYASTFACFASKRATDQVRMAIAQQHLGVTIVGQYSGLLTNKTGKSHQSIQDIAIMRAMPGMTVLAPGDACEAASAARVLARYDGPAYLRLARDPSPLLFGQDHQLEIGNAVLLRQGVDVTVLATGSMSSRALEAADLLAAEGIEVHLLHVPTIKPLDADTVLEAAAHTGRVVTAEEHNIIGGLGSAVAELLCERHPLMLRRVGVQDCYAGSGPSEALLDRYGVSAAAVAAACRKLLAS